MCLVIIEEENNNIFAKRQFLLPFLDTLILEKIKKTLNTSFMDDEDPFLCTLRISNYRISGELHDD